MSRWVRRSLVLVFVVAVCGAVVVGVAPRVESRVDKPQPEHVQPQELAEGSYLFPDLVEIQGRELDTYLVVANASGRGVPVTGDGSVTVVLSLVDGRGDDLEGLPGVRVCPPSSSFCTFVVSAGQQLRVSIDELVRSSGADGGGQGFGAQPVKQGYALVGITGSGLPNVGLELVVVTR